MSNILQIGFTTEGSTDRRFLSNVIRKTFEHVAFDCRTDIEVYEPEYLPKKNETSYVQQITSIASEYSYFHVICLHCDSDNPSNENVLRHKIKPALQSIKSLSGNACKNLVALIPVQMTEAWLLADLELLKNKIGTSMSNNELGLPTRIQEIERISDPKMVIIEAIRKAQANISRRRRKLSISRIYSPISQEISIEVLRNLSSYKSFMKNVRTALKALNYLSD